MYPEFATRIDPSDPRVAHLPDEAKAAMRAMQTSLRPSYAVAFTTWLREVPRGGPLDAAMALRELAGYEQKVLSESIDVTGGVLVPAAIYDRVAQRSIFRHYADVHTTVRDSYVQRRFMEHTTSGSLYASPFVGSGVSETPNVADTPATFGRIDVPIKKARAKTLISSDLFDDVPELVARRWCATAATTWR
jgi:HK97 family phage major capsid protein